MAQAPETLEGWWVLHDFRRLNWRAWREMSRTAREEAVAEAEAFLREVLAVNGTGHGSSAWYEVLTPKADLELLHLRPDPRELVELKRGWNRLRLNAACTSVYSFLSVVELSRYGSQGEDMSQDPRVRARLQPEIPPTAYTCFYPMNKRRGEHVNWYDLPFEERRALMRGHGAIGHKYRDRVVQVITGAQGLDDWEWGVDLFADDPVHFKKLIYEMRFDPASARYAEFGPFFVGLRRSWEDIRALCEATS